MNTNGVPPHRRVDRPSDADFFEAIYENLPGKKEARTTAVLIGVGSYLVGKALKKRGSRKS